MAFDVSERSRRQALRNSLSRRLLPCPALNLHMREVLVWLHEGDAQIPVLSELMATEQESVRRALWALVAAGRVTQFGARPVPGAVGSKHAKVFGLTDGPRLELLERPTRPSRAEGATPKRRSTSSGVIAGPVYMRQFRWGGSL